MVVYPMPVRPSLPRETNENGLRNANIGSHAKWDCCWVRSHVSGCPLRHRKKRPTQQQCCARTTAVVPSRVVPEKKRSCYINRCSGPGERKEVRFAFMVRGRIFSSKFATDRDYNSAIVTPKKSLAVLRPSPIANYLLYMLPDVLQQGQRVSRSFNLV